jgi:OPA family glycerol-3-phosphate transporter-like MFS transporter
MLSKWFSAEERATWWTAASSAQTLGGAGIAVVGSYITEYYGWRYTMHIPGIITVLLAIILYSFVSEKPEDEGFPPLVGKVEELKQTRSNTKSKTQEESKKEKEENILLDYIIVSPTMWLLALSAFSLYIVRSAIHEWIILMLMESRQLTAVAAGSCLFWFEIFGFVGGFAASIISDRVYKGDRIPVLVYFAVGIAFGVSNFDTSERT